MTAPGHDPEIAERALLKAVRATLRDPAKAGYTDEQCNIEFDEMAPATVGQLYIAVMAGGWRTGPTHNTQSGVTDLVFGVDVTIVKRIRNVPRDRTRDAFLLQLGNLGTEIGKVFHWIDWRYDLMDLANTEIHAENDSEEGFVEPLRFMSVDKRPSLVPGELFNGNGEKAGMKRTMYFHGARRVTHK